MAKRVSKKKANPASELDGPLSPEADKFLAEATEEFNTKQEALDRDWHFDDYKQWGFDQLSGVFRLEFADNTEFQADRFSAATRRRTVRGNGRGTIPMWTRPSPGTARR